MYTPQGNPMYTHLTNLPEKVMCLPISGTRVVLLFLNASGDHNLTPITGAAALRFQTQGSGYTMPHHSRSTIYGASSHGEVCTLADALGPLQTTDTATRVWVVVDATVDTHLVMRLCRLPLHQAIESGLTTQALKIWQARGDKKVLCSERGAPFTPAK